MVIKFSDETKDVYLVNKVTAWQEWIKVNGSIKSFYLYILCIYRNAVYGTIVCLSLWMQTGWIKEITWQIQFQSLPLKHDSFILKFRVKLSSPPVPDSLALMKLFLALWIPESICGHFLLRPSSPTSCLSSLKSSEGLAPEGNIQR